MQIVVGLGNPGERYKNTRHNAGWLALDNWLGDVNWSENKKFNALLHESGEFLFVKPLTFMNNSGMAVQKILNYYKLLPKNFGLIKKKNADLSETLIVVHDDLDLNLGDYKVAVDSASAGHRGVQSIIDYLKTKKITRLRLGVKNELLRTHIPPDKFVLGAFSPEEKERLQKLLAGLNIKNLK
ncbi:TPA: aminoacyl-tRNA hydrolase [Candidatus Falkowbacteria bacterium]|nr:MAG: Peptidyl-tRNA hydrolase [Candidatus Falkowbacteria bacterium GW2011_GWF2_43_32]HBA36301.1 aminoacyl-tRNA hydrolase [Candidatus Falkowbacteria bacterium]